MLTKEQFLLLRLIAESKNHRQPAALAAALELSEEVVHRRLEELQGMEALDEQCRITVRGLEILEPYRVKNAIILAAGMSTRFVPVSYELPKGLISVKGEVMTERLIRQLLEAGVGEIVLVVGYMMEKFIYLRDKFGVKLVVNNEYSVKNTHSSIYAARDHLNSTYIVCSDNYYPENRFHAYEYRAFYCSIYMPGVSYVERAFTFDEDGLVTDTNKPSHDQWVMYGHAYYSPDFTARFKPILESYYGRPGIEYMYWETIYSENVDKLPLWVQQCSPADILEFDSMEELQAYDPNYIENNRVKVFQNICRVLGCEFSDISGIEPVKKGLNNRSFRFACKGREYIYRHPGVNASSIIDRNKEATSLRVAKRLGVDNTLVHVDEEEGWKISAFVKTEEEFRFEEPAHLALLAATLKKLHSSGERVGFPFDYKQEAEKLLYIERFVDALSYRELMQTTERMAPIFEYLEAEPWQKSLCHNDLYEPNLLLGEEGLELIDWEFSGDNDIGFDVCKLFASQPELIAFEDADRYLAGYFGRPTDEKERLHLFACAAVIYYYWYVWGIYAGRNSSDVSDYMLVWHDKMMYYNQETMCRLPRAAGEEKG